MKTNTKPKNKQKQQQKGRVIFFASEQVCNLNKLFPISFVDLSHKKFCPFKIAQVPEKWVTTADDATSYIFEQTSIIQY